MNIGEAVAYGLLGGTAAAADHYVSDWREKTRMAREQAFQREGWRNQSEQAEKQRDFTADEAEKSRQHASGEADKERTFRAGQADQDVQRLLAMAQGKADIQEQYRDKGQQFTLDEQGKLIPVDPTSGRFAPPVAQKVNGQFSYLGVGKDGKGLLKGTGGKGSGSGSSKASDYYEVVKVPGPGGITREYTIYRDPVTGKEQTYTTDPVTQELIKVSLNAGQRPVTAEQEARAEQEAQAAIDEIQKWYRSDASDLKPWGGSEEAARSYFYQNALNGTLRNANGQLNLPETIIQSPQGSEPTTQPSPEPTITPESPARNTVRTQVNAPDALTRQHVIDLNNGKIEPDTFKNVFGQEAFDRYYQPEIGQTSQSPTPTTPQTTTNEYPTATIMPGHSGLQLGSWAKPDYFSQKEKQEQYEQNLRKEKEQEALKRQTRALELQSDIEAIIQTMKSQGISVREKMRLAEQLEVLQSELNSLQGINR